MVDVLPPPIPPFALAVASWIYVAVGASLAFLGRLIWGRLMTLVGIVLGGTVGWNLGALLLPGFLGPMALGLVGALLGAMLFTWIVEVALAAMAGALGLYVAYRSLLDYVAPDAAVIAGILVLLVVFSVTFYYMQGLLSYVTGLVGGVLTGVGLFLLTGALQTSILVAAAAAIAGTLLQELVLKRHEERLRTAVRQRIARRR